MRFSAKCLFLQPEEFDRIMEERIFKRKLYEKILQWKRERDGRTALLIKGARRVGKSTLAEEFARCEYESYILIDFTEAPQEVKDLFEDISNLDDLFFQLQFHYNTRLTPRKSVIIFDEVQDCPLARQAIKKLVKDHRYDYIEIGSLMSIKKNTKNIRIPSEETRLELRPMDYADVLCGAWPAEQKCVAISDLERVGTREAGSHGGDIAGHGGFPSGGVRPSCR